MLFLHNPIRQFFSSVPLSAFHLDRFCAAICYEP
jgi:hypothetical protein